MKYLRLRLLRVIPVFFLVTFASFALLNILPGDAADAILGGSTDSGNDEGFLEARDALRLELGLDRPMLVRYFDWLAGLMRGDFGESYVQIAPVWELLIERLPVTLELVVLSQIIAIVIAVPAAIYSALQADKLPDRIIGTVAFGLVAMPPFLLAILLVFALAVAL